MSVSAPEGIEITRALQDIQLGPWEDTLASVAIVNRAAVVGSHYPIFVTVSYDDKDVHHATTAQGIVDVLAAQPFFQSQRPLLWTLAALIVVGWLVFLGWRAATRKKRRVVDRP
jgi:hypothetical protein